MVKAKRCAHQRRGPHFGAAPGHSLALMRPWERPSSRTNLQVSLFLSLSLDHIRRSLQRSALTTLVTSFVMSKVDYCNAVLAGLPQRELDRVQSVVNAAVRLSADARRYDHVTPQ